MAKGLVTVFGGSGFLGRHIVRALAKADWRIRVAVRRPNRAHFLKPLGRVGQIQLFKCNVRDEDAVRAALKGADAAINLVGVLSEWGRQRFDALHGEAAGRIAKEARRSGVRHLLHVSAIGADANSTAHYARSKAAGEAAVREGFPEAVIFRPSIVFGPEDDFFNRFAWLARLSPVLPLVGGGHTRFQPVYAGDIAQAAVRALGDPACAGKTYELGGPRIYTFRELIELILRETRRDERMFPILVPLPFFLAKLKSYVLGLMPKPLLTPDQVEMLKTDNVAGAGALGFRDLGIVPDAVEAIVPLYLWRFRPRGQFETAVP